MTGRPPSSGTPEQAGRPAGLLTRVRVTAGAAGAVVLGALPHLLHHAGPLAGAALFAGVGGSILFGALGLVAAAPFLIKVRRRSGSWRKPAILLTVFAAMFAVSTLVVGPAIRGDDAVDHDSRPAGHDQHR